MELPDCQTRNRNGKPTRVLSRARHNGRGVCHRVGVFHHEAYPRRV
jgi:hypothetical protein